MALLGLSKIKKLYADDLIINGADLQLQPGEKAGLIGPNGSGKTTLLKIIAGELDADEGGVHLTRGARVGYLPQEPPELEGGTLRHHLERPLKALFALKRDIAILEEEISRLTASKADTLDKHLEEYAILTSRFEEEGGYLAESKLLGVARGLDFSDSDLDRSLETFSGGEKTRARMAGLLLHDYDLLLLDEPTNFLDFKSLQWLERYLCDLRSALLIVSHDRYFLDRVASRIFAFQKKQIRSYKGNYSAYLKQLRHEQSSLEEQRHRQDILKAREERLVREAKGDERSQRQAKSRQKRLEKMEGIELHEKEQRFRVGLNYTGRGSNVVVAFNEVSKSYESNTVLNQVSFEVKLGDRIALVGPNGAGKTTCLKLIAGIEEQTTGEIRIGPSVSLAYFSQEQEQLNPVQTLLEAIMTASDYNQGEARNHLGRYLFSGDDVFKRVKDLSGGERSRLALARLALGSGNCLLMDEPTSHLDLPALEELEKALTAYPGTMIIVSHDRYFLTGLTNRVFEMYGGKINIYNMGFSQYLKAGEISGTESTASLNGKEKTKKRRQEDHNRRVSEQRKFERLRREQKELEEKIAQKEEEVKKMEQQLSDPDSYGDRDNLAELGRKLNENQQQLNGLINRWEEVSAAIG